MAMYYYNPPEKDEDGKPFPPFAFSSSGTERVVFAHRYWKRAVVEYIIEHRVDKFGKPELDLRTGKQKVVKGRRSEWVLDEEKNAQLDAGEIPPPLNVIHLSKNEWNALTKPQSSRVVRPDSLVRNMKYLVSDEAVLRDQRKNLQELKKAQFEEYEKEKRLIEEERQALRAARADRERMRAEFEQETAELEKIKRPVGRPKKEARG